MSFCLNGHVQELETIKYVMHYLMNFYKCNLMYKNVTNFFVTIMRINFVFRLLLTVLLTFNRLLIFRVRKKYIKCQKGDERKSNTWNANTLCCFPCMNLNLLMLIFIFSALTYLFCAFFFSKQK